MGFATGGSLATRSLAACVLVVCTLVLCTLAAVASAADLPGKAHFDRWCAQCHAAGVGHPGTQQLERLRGASLALLEARNDLESAYIHHVVRHGQNAMPAYRPSEIRDAELEQIAQYLRRNVPAAKKQPR